MNVKKTISDSGGILNYKNFLLELGVEEIPAGFISSAVNYVKKTLENSFKKSKLKFDNVEIFSTPRRFTVIFRQLQMVQEKIVKERVGPAVKAAYDSEGNLTKAGQGFLRSAGASEEDVKIKKTDKGEYLSVVIESGGLQAEEIIIKTINEMIDNFQFPKSMKWSSEKFYFARPVRWIIMMLDDEVINYEYHGLKSDRMSYGTRFRKIPNPVSIESVETYVKDLKSVEVIADRDERKNLIKKQIDDICRENSIKIIEDPGLLDTVTDLVEFPTAILAKYDAKYTNLPQEIIRLTLSYHQKYFTVVDEAGKLTDQFIFVSNGNPEFADIIRRGNEKVVDARLEDALFYYQEDIKKPLSEHAERLTEVVFQKDLGTLREKADRIMYNAEYLVEKLNIADPDGESAVRAALLCKADLVTEMLSEKAFTKLQGYMGHVYALETGENKTTAEAINDHYKPIGEKSELPETCSGAIVALADKMDTICGIIGVGMLPTGSKDPFALRRAANGVVRIIADRKFDFDLSEFIQRAVEVLGEKFDGKHYEFVTNYFKQRIEWYLKSVGFDYDIVESVLINENYNIFELIQKAEVLKNIKGTSEFDSLVSGYKRAANIISKVKVFEKVDRDLFSEEAETLLFSEYQKVETLVSKQLESRDYELVVQTLVSLNSSIHRFFDEVLVNAEEMEIRNNRYNLLKLIVDLFKNFADITKIVIEGE